jgi:hypothetical protein
MDAKTMSETVISDDTLPLITPWTRVWLRSHFLCLFTSSHDSILDHPLDLLSRLWTIFSFVWGFIQYIRQALTFFFKN